VEELAGRVAFVTGSAGGIGLGIARACARAGMRVVLADIDDAALARAASELGSGDADVMAVALDVTDRDGWRGAADRVHAAMGPVQLLVNNAGVAVSTLGLRIGETSPELWDRVIGINITGVYNGVQSFLEGMQAAGEGHIVNTSSMAGVVGGYPMLVTYCAAKFGVVGFSEALRAELAGSGVGVSVLCPGPVRTGLWRSSRVALGLPVPDELPEHLSRLSTSTRSDAMAPDEVGRRVLRAVVDDELYIFTHPSQQGRVTDRYEQQLRGFAHAAAFADEDH
jgi:NAD(P)-dependent dehydrogenase (short-subunit alcohol dehydrogenase family)